MGLKAKRLLLIMIITLLMLTVSNVVSAGSVWDGSVSIARYGYLPHTGMYAASNAFPQNSRVTVTNPKTGKSVNVIVLERLEDNNLFLVLSSEAAESIGISYGDIFHGSISEQVITGPEAEEDIPYNPDPDVNPSALSGGYSELALIQDYIDTELGGVDDDLIIPDTEVEPIIPDEFFQEESETTDTIVPEAIEEIIEEQVDPIEIAPELVEDTLPVEEILAEIDKEEPVEEIIEDTADPVSVSELVEDEVPELVEEVEVEPDIPLVENMPLEEVYIGKQDGDLPEPDIVEIVTESVVDDIPEVVGMSTSVTLVVVDTADVRENVPELPVQEADTPVVTSMSIEDLEKTDNGIIISELPELPIIGVEEVLSDEKPIAVTMTADVVSIEEVEDISPILPEVISIEEESALPDIEEFLAREPDTEVEIVIAAIEPEIEVPEEEIVVVEEPESRDDLLVEVEVVLEPSDLRPPVVDSTEIEVEEETIVVAVVNEDIVDSVSEFDRYNLTRELVKDSYYLQLGAYREQYSALDLAGRLGGMYPVTVYISDSTDTLNYKVMVGPLGQDESGAVLYSFKSSGYPDAFLRKGL